MPQSIIERLKNFLTVHKLIALYWVVLILSYIFYSSYYFHIDFLGRNARLFSLLFIPILTLVIHLALLKVLSRWAFTVLLLLDSIADLAVSIHHSYFGEAPSIVSLVSAFREASTGVAFAFAFIPKGLLLFLALKFILLISLGYALKKQIKWPTIRIAGLVAAPLMMVALIARPPI